MFVINVKFFLKLCINSIYRVKIGRLSIKKEKRLKKSQLIEKKDIKFLIFKSFKINNNNNNKLNTKC